MNDLHHMLAMEPAEVRRNGGTGLRSLPQGAGLRLSTTAARMPEARPSANWDGSKARGVAEIKVAAPKQWPMGWSASSQCVRARAAEIKRRSAANWEVTV